MEKKVFVQLINNSLISFGFRKQGTRKWIRMGDEVSLKVCLQKSQFGDFYYLRDYYVLNKMQVNSSNDNECPGDIVYSDEKLLNKMCDLENDVTDNVREISIKKLLKEAFEDHHYIKTEEELKEMIFRRLPFVFQSIKNYLGISPELYESLCKQREKMSMMQRLAKVFEFSPTNDHEILNEEKGFCVTYNLEDQEILVRLNVFVNPYKQNVEEVYQQKLDRLEYFTKVVPFENPMQEVERIEADKPSKLGFMHIELTIPDYVADVEGIEKVKEAIFKMQEEQLSYENFVWFKSKHNGRTCYFEYGHWTFKRAVIMGENGHQCFDFTEETRSHQEMLGDLTNDYDQLEYSDSFALISSEEFQKVWDATTIDHEPEPWD